ncbi:hypothetical protein [Streptomyces sp. NPDC003483]
MGEGSTAREEARPIPWDCPDQQAGVADPLDIETMLCHAQQGQGEVPTD